ncbi:MAG: integrase core domain-containing protein [Candidatus Vogelbacteria bacterium]|nr:integrase core domain-containing protein [Candidatus Vogelbacteria bacterium]
MAYTLNPNLPKVRGQAVAMVEQGKSVREVARYFGFSHSAVVKWVKRSNLWGYGPIPTRSSKPKRSPNALSREVVEKIIVERSSRQRCAEHVFHELKNQGVVVSLSSVKRTLDRCHLLKKRSLWKRPHDFTPRPEATFAGALIQIDTIHIMAPDGSRIYIYTLIDLYSRWAYAEVMERIGAQQSLLFVERAQRAAGFKFIMMQSDHGPEFSVAFTHGLWRAGMAHRHSRVRKSNDNAHVERFNRTIQEECLDKITHSISSFARAIPEYLNYYNNARTHMGINYQIPCQLVPRS